MIVVDANAVLYALLPGDHHLSAAAWWSTGVQRMAPPLILDEVRNVLLGFVRRKSLTLEEAKSLYLEARESVEIVDFHDTQDLLSLAHALGLSGYDVVYLALARAMAAPLLTADKRLLAADPIACRDVRRPPET